MARAFALALALAMLVPAAALGASQGPKGGGPLSAPLEELAEPTVGDGTLAAQARHLGLPRSGPGSLVRDGGKVFVTARLANRTVTLAVAPGRLKEFASVPGVKAVWQVRAPIAFTPAGQCEGGASISEGLSQLRVDDARAAFDLRGKGQTVGVLSDSYDVGSEAATDAHGDVLSGDLPGPAGSCAGQQLPVDVLAEGPAEGEDEGRGMLQIVHDLAPHASLAFATAFESEESFAVNIERLARPTSEGGAGAGVIVDDVAWFEEPFFQDGPIAVAIDNVSAEGVTYLSSAGNDNLFEGENEIASWEAPAFRDSGECPQTVEELAGFNGTHCMDFDPTGGTDPTFGITVEAGETLTLDLQWAEPWFGVNTDLDAFLLTPAGKLLASSFEENPGPTGTQRPVEIVQWKNTSASPKTVELAVNQFSGTSPRLKFILLQNGGGVSATEYPESSEEDVVGPTLFGHAGTADAIAVAATPFYDSSEIESYSSRGPVTHYFGPVEGTTPAAALGSPEEVEKPDLAATDCGATTFFAFLAGGTWRFCGTSAAAPHAAAIAAIVRQAKPTLSVAQVRAAMTDAAVPVGAFGSPAAGAGLLDAFAAIEGIPGPIETGDGPSGQVPGQEGPVAPPSAGGGSTIATPPVVATPSPSAKILKHPLGLVRTSAGSVLLVFRFGSDQTEATFLCRVDRAPFGVCPRRFARRYGLGSHVLKVKAQSSTGVSAPVVLRFRVARRG